MNKIPSPEQVKSMPEQERVALSARLMKMGYAAKQALRMAGLEARPVGGVASRGNRRAASSKLAFGR